MNKVYQPVRSPTLGPGSTEALDAPSQLRPNVVECPDLLLRRKSVAKSTKSVQVSLLSHDQRDILSPLVGELGKGAPRIGAHVVPFAGIQRISNIVIIPSNNIYEIANQDGSMVSSSCVHERFLSDRRAGEVNFKAAAVSIVGVGKQGMVATHSTDQDDFLVLGLHYL